MRVKKLGILPISLLTLFLTVEAENYARRVLSSTPPPPRVDNPENVLFESDGELAQIYYGSHIDVELSDHAKKLKIKTKQLWEDRRFGTKTYAVYVEENKDDNWELMGMGKIGAVDYFCLDKRAKYVRFMYVNQYDHIAVPAQLKKVMGVDSVEGLD